MPSTPPSRAVRAGVALSAVVLLASCSDQGQAPNPEELSPSPVKQEDKDKQAVEATLDAYNQVVKTSLSTRKGNIPIARIRRLLAEPYATKFGRQLASERSAGLVMRGTDTYTTRSIKIRGDRATLVTCWDPTDADIVNTYAKPVQKVKPAPPTETTFTFERSGADWKIARRKPGKDC